MLWIRNVDGLRSIAAEETLTAELASEVEISGLLNYENGAILCAQASFVPDARGLHKYDLKVQLPPAPREELPEGTAEGYLFREGPVGELAALFSLHLQTRFFILSTAVSELTDHSIPLRTEYEPIRGRFGQRVDAVIFSNEERNFAKDLPTFLDLIRRIPPKHHLRVATSAYHYARALREVGVDEEMVFVRLVSAIETAARRHPIGDDALFGRKLAELVRPDAVSPEQMDELERTFHVRKAKARFVSFLNHYSDGFFESEATEPPHTQVTPQNLPAVAGAIYDARSGYLHSGSTMYLSQWTGGHPEWHMDPSVGMLWQNRRFKAEQKLPRAQFFHRLVRFCLLKYFANLASAKPAG